MRSTEAKSCARLFSSTLHDQQTDQAISRATRRGRDSDKWGQSKNQEIQTDFVNIDARYSGILGIDPIASSTEIVDGES
jgi:hypothetical protein